MSDNGAATALNKESLGIFSLFIVILCVPVRDKHKHFLFLEHVCHIMEQLWPYTRNPLVFFSFLFVYITFMCSCS